MLEKIQSKKKKDDDFEENKIGCPQKRNSLEMNSEMKSSEMKLDFDTEPHYLTDVKSDHNCMEMSIDHIFP